MKPQQHGAVSELASTISLIWEYNTDLFEPATIERMMRHFQVLLERVAADPDRRVSELPLMGEAERRHLLVEWNDTRTAYPREATIQQLFEEQAARAPDGVLVVCGRFE